VKSVILTLSAFLVVGLLATPVIAQDVEPDVDAGAEGLVYTCLRISTTGSIDGLEPAAIGQLLLGGQATAELLEPEACEPEPAGAKRQPRSKSTPYVEFVARGAGAAIELVALAERHDSAQDLDDLDRAAKSLSAWAQSQRKWLDRHPPQACYAGVHAQWRRGVVDVRQGAKAVHKSIRTLKAQPMRRAVRRLSRGARELASVDLDQASKDCTADALP
jgi:hypothetical protein